MSRLVIATRSSPLAVYQASWVREKLTAVSSAMDSEEAPGTGKHREIVFLKVKSADYRHKDSFVRTCQEKLLSKEADIAVHSAKDLPVVTRPELCLAAICERGEVSDALVGTAPWSDLPVGSRIGTTSLRRRVHLLAMRPDLHVTDLRGNIETRLSALSKRDQDAPNALVLAAAGLSRLGYEQHICHRFSTEEILPAPGQGAYAIECRKEDEDTINFVGQLNHLASAACVRLERLFCRLMGADCYSPLAAYAELTAKGVRLRTMTGGAKSGKMLKSEQFCELSPAERTLLLAGENGQTEALTEITKKTDTLAKESARDLFARGAGELLAE